MGFYQTVILAFCIGIAAIWIASKLPMSENPLQRPLILLSGIAMIGVILWLLLQIFIGLPSLAQTVDLPAIGLGLLIAYGFENAKNALIERAKNKFK